MKKPSSRRSHERSSLMSIGRKVDYAVRALTYLAARPAGTVVSKAEIQSRQRIPPHFLSKIMKQLGDGGLVRAHHGPRGGFALRRPARQISLRQVYECVEGPLVVIECLDRSERFCAYSPVCPQMGVWRGARSLLASYLGRFSISDIVDEPGLAVRLERARQDGRKSLSG